ncbi:CCR4-NOT core subunit cdc39, partial [Bonamia ostreae]
MNALTSEHRDAILLSTVVFVSRVLKSCAFSIVFSPPNPWLMGILGLLKEIYSKDDVDINVKFEIEELLKSLRLDVADIKSSFVLLLHNFGKNLKSSSEIFVPSSESSYSPMGKQIDFGADFGSNQTAYLQSYQDGRDRSYYPMRQGSDFAIHYITESIQKGTKIEDVPMSLSNPQTIRLLTHTISHAVSDNFAAVLDRCVGITSRTTMQIVGKDLEFEPNRSVFESMSLCTAESLACNLVLAICKDPLRWEVYNSLKAVLLPILKDGEEAKRIASSLAKANFGICCKAVTEVASIFVKKEVEQMIKPSIELRERYSSSGMQFPGENTAFQRSKFKTNFNEEIYPNSLPFELQPRRGGLSENQISLYNNYAPLFENHLSQTCEWAQTEANFLSMCEEDDLIEKSLLEREQPHKKAFFGIFEEDNTEHLQSDSFATAPMNSGVQQAEWPRNPEKLLFGEHFANEEVERFGLSTNRRLSFDKINTDELSNFELIKRLGSSLIKNRYDDVAKMVNEHPQVVGKRLAELKEDDKTKQAVTEFLGKAAECCASIGDSDRVILLLLADHVYNEMFKFASSLLFVDLSV